MKLYYAALTLAVAISQPEPVRAGQTRAGPSTTLRADCSELPLAAFYESGIETPAPELISNFRRVNETVFRSGWPGPGSLRYLHEKLGIRTIINLIAPETKKKAALTAEEKRLWLGLRPGYTEFVHIPIANRVLFQTDLPTIFKTLEQIRRAQTRGRVLIHCAGGRDRTGLAVATLRVLDGCDPLAALAEYLNADRKHLFQIGRYPSVWLIPSKIAGFNSFLNEYRSRGPVYRDAAKSCPDCFR